MRFIDAGYLWTSCPAEYRRGGFRAPIGVGTTPAIGLVLALGLALVLGGCSTNPATGKSQLALIGEQQEIALGREAAGQIPNQLGLYDDPEVQSYVSGIGRAIATDSERPSLPWSFQVVDDPVVNAFALPGGFIFVTRGLLTHLTSEAELAAVVGHEIGHVTGRHSVEQMSKAQLAQLGLVAGSIVSPEFARYGDLASTGLGLLFLKYGRDDEREADDLGLRYLGREGYDPREMAPVFETLGRVSQQQGQGRIPNWLSTHPAPEDRVQRISGQVAQLGGDFSGRKVGREPYLAAIDGVVFGEDPRQGYFLGSRFIHPGLGFEVRFPEGWKTENQRSAVGAVSSQQDAIVVLSLASQSTPQAAAQQFFAQQGIEQGSSYSGAAGRLTAVANVFEVPRQQGGNLRGIAAFTAQGNRVFQLLGYTTEGNWGRYESQLAGALATFGAVTDRRLLEVQPKRVEVVSLPSAMTLAEFARRYPSTVDLQTLAIINQVAEGASLPAGAEVKRVVGGELPGGR